MCSGDWKLGGSDDAQTGSGAAARDAGSPAPAREPVPELVHRGVTAWEAFEVWDLVLFVLALGSIAAGLGLAAQDVDVVDRRFLPAAVAAVAVIVASQIIDPPPAAAGQDPDTGAWLALGAALVMCAGRRADVRPRAPGADGRGARPAPARRRRGRARARRTRRPTVPPRRGRCPSAGACSRATRPAEPEPSPSSRAAGRRRRRRSRSAPGGKARRRRRSRTDGAGARGRLRAGVLRMGR